MISCSNVFCVTLFLMKFVRDQSPYNSGTPTIVSLPSTRSFVENNASEIYEVFVFLLYIRTVSLNRRRYLVLPVGDDF